MVLKSLKSGSRSNYNVMDIFYLLGTPSILQSGNSREFANDVVTSVKEYSPVVRQGSVERAIRTLKIYCTWMQDEKLTSELKDRFVHL